MIICKYIIISKKDNHFIKLRPFLKLKSQGSLTVLSIVRIYVIFKSSKILVIMKLLLFNCLCRKSIEKLLVLVAFCSVPPLLVALSSNVRHRLGMTFLACNIERYHLVTVPSLLIKYRSHKCRNIATIVRIKLIPINQTIKRNAME